MGREIIYRGRKIQLAVDPLVLPDGRMVQREIVLHPGAVAISAVGGCRSCLFASQSSDQRGRNPLGDTRRHFAAAGGGGRRCQQGAGGRDRLSGRPLAQVGRVLSVAGHPQRTHVPVPGRRTGARTDAARGRKNGWSLRLWPGAMQWIGSWTAPFAMPRRLWRYCCGIGRENEEFRSVSDTYPEAPLPALHWSLGVWPRHACNRDQGCLPEQRRCRSRWPTASRKE